MRRSCVSLANHCVNPPRTGDFLRIPRLCPSGLAAPTRRQARPSWGWWSTGPGSRGHANSATIRAACRLAIQATASLWPSRSASFRLARHNRREGHARRGGSPFIVVDPRVAVDQWCPSATDQPRRENQPRNWCGRDVRGPRRPACVRSRRRQHLRSRRRGRGHTHPIRDPRSSGQCFRATPQYTDGCAVSSPAAASVSGFQRGHGTTPGSIRSSPSKKLASSSARRRW